MIDIGIKIKNMRKLRGWTQIELANRLDISTIHIKVLETNERNPSLDLLEKIALIFGKKLVIKFEDL